MRIFLFLLWLFGVAFFSVGETVLFSLHPRQIERIRKRDEAAGRRLIALLGRPRRLLLTLLLGGGLCKISAAIEGTLIIRRVLADPLDRPVEAYWPYLVLLTAAVVAPVLFLFGEIVPRRLALTYAESLAPSIVRPIRILHLLLSPLRRAVHAVTEGTIRLLGGSEMSQQIAIEEARIRSLLDPAGERFNPTERELLDRIFALKETLVQEIMTPRTDIFSLSIDLPLSQIIERVRKGKHSRIPIYQGSIDQIVGVLYAKDLFLLNPADAAAQSHSLRRIIRPPYFVPGSKRANALLREFQLKKQHLAIVVDEFGGTAGIITLEDILEEIFGEIHDELDTPEPLYREIAPGRYLVSGKLPLDIFNQLMRTRLPDEDSDTVGGFVLHLFGTVPEREAQTQFDRFRFTVEKLEGPRIKEVVVERLPSPPPAGEQPRVD
ncbi:MAG: HlyC/CorC family transporter [Deltaproteobacteria bacterium]|nr:MAG: HlyC/CorC family transporter [Deltaproteobacteria bacterium]